MGPQGLSSSVRVSEKLSAPSFRGHKPEINPACPSTKGSNSANKPLALLALINDCSGSASVLIPRRLTFCVAKNKPME